VAHSLPCLGALAISGVVSALFVLLSASGCLTTS
jgi:hypothetical protein